MVLTIVVLNQKEEFLEFLDPDLCTLEETIEYGGLRTLSFEYKFRDLVKDKELFRIGNKIWIQGDTNLSDCLYVINTEVKQDIYKENSFTLELEEILVELNYAPVFPQTELQTAVDYEGHSIFRLISEHGKEECIVDWNALNYWFGDYFNIGIVQDPISEYAKRISITGTINRMELLRNIEEETGNVFVTRYEKDILDNTIHRYLDFLNPINCNKNWTYNLEYDFNNVENISVCYDQNGNIIAEDQPSEVTRFENTAFDPEAIDEDTDTSDEDDYDVEQSDTYDTESNEIYPFEEAPDYTPIRNLNPTNCRFQITDSNYQVLNTNGEPYKNDGDTPLTWECTATGMTSTDYPRYLITLQKNNNLLGVTVNTKEYCIAGIGDKGKAYLPELRDDGTITISQDNERTNTYLPDDSFLEIYDHQNDYVIFRTQLNIEIGKVHEEILDFGYNLENIEYNIDETNTYTAVSPIINPNNETDRNGLSRTDINTVINRWLDLGITKGTIIPMIVEKFNINGDNVTSAASSMGTYSRTNNYYIRPLKPNDNTDNTPKQFEFYRAVAYWKAPYTKQSGRMYVETDKVQNIDYTDIYTRPDTRADKAGVDTPKMGNTETSDEDVFMIYNQVVQYLKQHETPEINIDLDVANLRGHEFNNYELHDKIYIKLANTQELITARVTKTTKEAHDIAKNTIEITNYHNVNTIKTITHETYIEAPNAQFTYPASKNLTARLINTSPDSDTDQYPAGKLLSFTVYKIDNNSPTLTGTTYTRLTDALGYATIGMKFEPGDYEIDIQFMGDEEYEESNLIVTVNVDGTIPQPATTTNNNTSTRSRTVTTKNKKTITTYWTKCGLSPDKKHKEIVAIAKPSGPDAHKYSYKWYKTVFKNYCPICKRWGGLRYDGKKNKCIKSAGAMNRGYKVGVPEHEITCNYCDSDYCGVTGSEKWNPVRGRLKTVKKPVAAKTGEYSKLIKGKLVYATKTVTVTSKKVVNTQNRTIRASGISNTMKQLAKSIVKNKTGSAAMKAIVEWCDKHIKYGKYPNFQRSPDTVYKKKSGNCCDGTRFFFTLCDAAGLCQYYNFFYVHVPRTSTLPGHVYGIVETKKSKKWRYVDMASDRHTCWGYVCQGYSKQNQRNHKYPKLPF